MASTFSNLKIQLMATGENSGTWGNTTNVNLGTAIEQALVETATVTFASGNVTLTLTDSNSAQNARALRLNLAGTTAGARDLIVPAIQKPYIVNNGTADIITVKVTGQTGVAVPASTSMLLYNNGTDVGLAFNRVVGNLVGTASNATVLQTARTIAISGNVTGTATSFNGSGDISIPVTAINVDAASAGTLAVARGGTGANTLTDNNVILGNTTGAVKFVSPGTDGNVLTSNGTAWVSEAISAGGNFVQQVYTSPATWTKPANIKAVRVYVAGGGGGGGGANPTFGTQRTGGSAGAGGTGFKYISEPSIPGPVTVTVGSGGAGGGTGATGTAGGTTSFGPFLSATGGSAGAGSGNGGGANGNPGAPTGGDLTCFSTPAAGGNTFFAGVGAAVGFSQGLAATNNTGSAGTGRMSGGGGGNSLSNPGEPPTTQPGRSGGTGSNGVVIVEEFY